MGTPRTYAANNCPVQSFEFLMRASERVNGGWFMGLVSDKLKAWPMRFQYLSNAFYVLLISFFFR